MEVRILIYFHILLLLFVSCITKSTLSLVLMSDNGSENVPNLLTDETNMDQPILPGDASCIHPESIAFTPLPSKRLSDLVFH